MSNIFDLMEIKVPLHEVSHNHFSGIVDLFEGLDSFSKADLGLLSDFMHKTLNAQLRSCDPAVRDVILDEDSQAHAIRQAYALGKLSFGQELVANAYSRRADDTFVPIVLQKSNRKLVRAMLAGQKTQAELAAITGQTPNTVMTKLRVLQGLGAAEYRSNGKDWVYFLTGAGKAVLEANKVSPLRVDA